MSGLREKRVRSVGLEDLDDLDDIGSSCKTTTTTSIDTLATPAPECALRSVGVPLEFHAATFATKDTAALRHARAWLVAGGVEHGRALGLFGPAGIGKTWSEAATINAVLVAYDVAERNLFVHERHPVWYSCPALVRDVRSYSTAQETMRRLRRAILLVIDELTVPDAAALAVLDEVLSLRHAERLATVFTSNMTAAELAGALSDRILDRLRVWSELHEITGRSLRT